jgi:leader peptidase (prepilin peptidase)/N-methyltransferase
MAVFVLARDVVALLLVLGAVASAVAMPRLVAAFAPFEGETVRLRVPERWVFLVVTTVAVAAVVVALFHGSGSLGWLPAYLYLTVVGVVLAAVDARVHRLPDAIVLPSYPVLAALFAVAAASDSVDAGDWLVDGQRAQGALLGAGILLALFAVVRFLSRGGLGWGDVKLVGLLGGALGWLGRPGLVLLGLVVGLLSAGLYAGFLLVTRRARGRDHLAYGPHLLLGAFVVILLGLAHR